MRITVIGTGYVGLVTGACLADVGNDVLCIDKDAHKIGMLAEGEIPIYEPGLKELVHLNVDAGRLTFSTSIAEGVDHGDILFIAVGTPPGEDGSANLQHILDVAAQIGEHINAYRIVVTKSTVPVGTASKISMTIKHQLGARGVETSFSVVSNPEFLKEGGAVDDFMKPDRIIVGADDDEAIESMRRLYAPFNRNHERVIVMDIKSAELTKYAANALLATKISFMNEMANIAEALGADVESVRRGIGSDPRIGYAFIYPGCGYGGSCFPKDIRALHKTAQDSQYEARILAAVEAVNSDQRHFLVRKITEHFGESLAGLRFALWGLAFKPDTDDIREAPSRYVLESLWALGAEVVAYDPVAMPETQRAYAQRSDLLLAADQYSAVDDADALIVVTEWKAFRSPDFEQLARRMRRHVIFDGRNIFDPPTVRDAGFAYFGIGRPSV